MKYYYHKLLIKYNNDRPVIILIKNNEQLEKYLNDINEESILGIDTEFRRIDSYSPELCLVQIASKSHLECIDVLSINNLEPLFDKLYDGKTLWVIHSARQDIEALYYLSGRTPSHLFDTQIGASFLNYPIQVSYQAITEKLQNIFLEKKFTRFDWRKRPLPNDVLKYALDDVKYLLPNYRILKKELVNQGKLSWAEEEVQFLLNKDTYEPNYRQILKKTKGINKISHKNQENAFKLIHWRESIAQQKNKPRKWIMSDESLIDYASGQRKLSDSQNKLFENFIRKSKLIAGPEDSLSAKKPLSESETLLKNQLKDKINLLSTKYAIPSELICSSKNLVKLIKGDNTLSIQSGWRSELFKL
ncbi:ribonuclease D [Candidatus Pseudothioglobus singularis]|uniref:ribonuclease D n=1 Tax=Candidatus Pseudothioglobus singularis TaxID=1427364 RepID=UPI0008062A5B|nr:ribonuclease D [Candidatus Pseudothioglobus singularis]